MVHRGIATLSLAVMMCFLLLSHYDGQFFLLHFYESLIYLLIVLMLFYFEDRWAYMLGILAPATWLLMTFATGGLGGFLRQFERLLHAERPDYAAGLLGAVTTILSLLMIAFCGYRWRREYAGFGRGWNTFLVSLGVVVLYYGILVFWFLRSITAAPAFP